MCSQEIIQFFFTNELYLISKEKKQKTENFLNEYGFSDLLVCAENKKDAIHVIYIVEPNELGVFEKRRPDCEHLYYKADLLNGGVYHLNSSPTADETKKALNEFDDF